MLAPLGLVASLLIEHLETALRREAGERLQVSAQAAAATLRLRLADLAATLERVREQLPGPGPRQAELQRSFSSLGIREGFGYRELLAGGPPEEVDWDLHPDDLAHLRADRPLLSYGHSAGQLRPVLILPLQRGQADGPLLIACPQPHLLFAGPALEPGRGNGLIVSETGAVLGSSHPQRIPASALAAILRGRAEGDTLRLRPEGEALLSGLQHLDLQAELGRSWFIVHSRPLRSVLATMAGVRQLVWASCLLLALLASFGINLLLHRFLMPLQRLQVFSGRLAADADCPPIPDLGDSPFGGLADDLQALRDRLQTDRELRERAAAELATQRGEALAATQAQSRFLCSMSHELRTPLTGILSYAELLRDPEAGADPATREEFLTTLSGQAQHLHGLIEDLLNLAEIETGSADWDFMALDLRHSITRSLEQRPGPERRRIQVQMPADALQVQADAAHLELCWRHLLDNALRFSPADTQVSIRVQAEAGSCVVEIRDAGPGIRQADWQRIFEPFEQASIDQLTAKDRGAGLGLALVRDIVRRHGGQVRVGHSGPEGTTMRVLLPLLRGALSSPGQDLEAPGSGAGKEEGRKHRVLLTPGAFDLDVDLFS